jgi:NAD(P)-dependent dehydrogenase (short-subunit alcohol dehydrogenase family)
VNVSSQFDVAGFGVVVTGGASGLGLATAAELAGAGAAVVIADLPSSPGAQRAAEIGATFVPVDVTDDSAVREAVGAAQRQAPLRVVVNCAGIGTPGRVLGKQGVLPLDTFERVVRVNLVGTFNVIRLAAEAMVANEPVDGERGVFVNTASVAAFDGQIGQAAYSASKGGVVGMTLPVARDLADKYIRVCTIAPGIMDTPMLAGLPEAARESLGRQVPNPARLGSPSEYAALARHIVENGYLNGEVIRLDGAIRMAPR